MNSVNNKIKTFLDNSSKLYMEYEKEGSNVTFSCEGVLTCYFKHSSFCSFVIGDATITLSSIKSVKAHANVIKIVCSDGSKIILKKI